MRFFFKIVVLFLIIHKSILVSADEIRLDCNILKNSNLKGDPSSFTKYIDLDTGILNNVKGLFYDNLIQIGENEIIFNNSIYESYSVYGINSNIWTVYYDRKILIYKCKKALLK